MRIDQERTQKSMESLNKTFEKEVEKRVVVEVGVRQSERENALREELVTLADKWDSEGELKGEWENRANPQIFVRDSCETGCVL